MDIVFQFWHWIVFGVLLICMEILLPSFTLFWFGCGALIVGALLWVFPELALEWQLVIWGLLSVSFAGLWFKVIKPLSIDKTKAGLGLESMIGEVGLVVHVTSHGLKGKVRFPAPILGSDEWMFFAEKAVSVGDSVKVVNISGNRVAIESSGR
ncbi:Uncharacterised protein [BD1-7 clade bacterium]|uniref:Uncharacterized protein n=1 Tax=BD1-7 clade bacterium TaxID=2029982 RepID=A0A5S9QVN6_9GAMM|nr:Uncharacterised protein [BD1-7 clade bacterium]